MSKRYLYHFTSILFALTISNYTFSQTNIFGNSVPLKAMDNCTPFDSLTFIQSPLPGTVINYSTRLNDVNSLSVSITTIDLENNFTTCNFDVLGGCRVNASIPQIFSPNGDGINDKLYVYGRNFSNFQFIVYNRWGRESI